MRGAILNDNYISYMYFLEEIVTIYNLIMCDGEIVQRNGIDWDTFLKLGN